MDATSQKPALLLIDDQKMVAELIQHKLSSHPDIVFNYEPVSQRSLETCLRLNPTVIIVDLVMPDLDGFGVIRLLRSHPDTALIPIILLSSEEDPEIKARAFAEGANDYLVKWPDKRELVARVLYHSNAYLAHKQRDDAFRFLRESQHELLTRTEQLAQSQAALQQAQKMEAIGQLTGGIAHDFNNLLQVINGNLELLKFLNDSNDLAQQRIASAMKGVERGAKLCTQLLAIARRQPLQSVIIDVAKLLSGMKELLHRTLGNAIRIELDIEEGIWNTAVDTGQLENVLLNLAINARDAMEDGGTLTISARNIDAHSNEKLLADSASDHVLIEIADTGTGMSPEVLNRVFELFFTTKPVGQGTGLGLSMVYGFVQQTGGHIKIDSEVGSGTRVSIFLPREDGTAQDNSSFFTRPASGSREVILVVEDEAEVRETTIELLNKLGYSTLEAEDGENALRVIESGAPIDVLFSDVVMPGPVRSSQLAEKARQLIPGIRILFTSGYLEQEIAQRGKLDADIHVLKKPYTAETLAMKLQQLLHAGAVLPPSHESNESNGANGHAS